MASAKYFPIKEPGDLEVDKWSPPSIRPENLEVVGFCSYDKETDRMRCDDLTQVPYYHDYYEKLYSRNLTRRKNSIVELFESLKINLNHRGAIKDNYDENKKLEEFLEWIAKNKDNEKLRVELGSQRYANSII